MITDKLKDYEQQVFLEYKNRENEKQLEKIKKQKHVQNQVVNPCIKNNLITWIDVFGNGNMYLGTFKNDNYFEIKRGVCSFSLKTINKNLKAKSYSSIYIYNLQKKANDIFQNHYKSIKT